MHDIWLCPTIYKLEEQKEILHPKMKILSWIAHPRVNPMFYIVNETSEKYELK